jgi:acyl-CoA reductase-like NAD-dependent aldehyde dehydrogenase
MTTMPVAPPERTGEARSELEAAINQVVEIDPWLGLSLVRALGTATPQWRAAIAAQLLDAVADARRMDGEVDRVVASARAAQHAFENWTDDRIDHLLGDMAKALAAKAAALAEMTVNVTRIGNVRDKTVKNRFASLGVYESIAGKTAQGMLSYDPERQVAELASPMGVVLAVVPATSPVATAMFKTLIALKGRNALIVCFPRQAQGLGTASGSIIRRVLETHGAPVDLVQWIDRHGGRRLTRKFMRHPGVSIVLATGGPELMKAAYSSGKPAIAVGPGNAPAWICADADLPRAARATVTSKAFDNGLTAGTEDNLVVDDRCVDRLITALEQHGGAVLTAAEVEQFAATVLDSERRTVRREFVGRSAATIARAAGIVRPNPIRLLVVSSASAAADNFSAHEKLAPIVSLFSVSGEDEGIRLCRTLLAGSGAGHTAVIHTSNAARVERFARAIPAGRILVNTPAAPGGCGITTGLDASMTLGCGTFGGNATSDNVTYRHLLNIKRVARDLGPDRLRRLIE